MIMDALMFFDGSISSAGVLSGTSVSSGVTFAVGSTNSTNVIDVSQVASSASGLPRDIGSSGEAHDLNIICQVATAFTGGGNSTLQVQVATAPDNGSGGIGSYTVLALTAETIPRTARPARPLGQTCHFLAPPTIRFICWIRSSTFNMSALILAANAPLLQSASRAPIAVLARTTYGVTAGIKPPAMLTTP